MISSVFKIAILVAIIPLVLAEDYRFAVTSAETRNGVEVSNFAPCRFAVEHALNHTIPKYLNLTNSFRLTPTMFNNLYTNQGSVSTAFDIVSSVKTDPTNPYIAVIGDQLSGQCRVTANIYDSYQIPQMSPSCGDSALSDKAQFPGFIRGVSVNINDAIVKVIKETNSKRIAVLALNNDYGILAAQVIQAGLKGYAELSETFLVPTNLTQAADPTFFNQIIQRQYRIIVYRGNQDVVFSTILLNAQRQGLLGSNYLWIIGSGELSIINNLPLSSNQSISTQDMLQQSHFLAIRPQVIEGHMLYDFVDAFVRTNYTAAKTVKQNGPTSLDWVTTHCHDLTLVLASAVNSALSKQLIPRGANLTRSILATQLYGISGLLAFNDKTYDRLQDLDLVEMQFQNNTLQWNLQAVWYPLTNQLNTTKVVRIAQLNLPSDRPPSIQVRLSIADQIVGIVLAVILHIIVIVSIVLIVVNRNKLFIKHCSPIFTCYYLVGLLGFSSSIYLFVFQASADNLVDSNQACQSQPWIIGIFFIAFFTICLCKTIRLYIVFKHTFKTFLILENKLLTLVWLGLIILEIIWNIIWYSGTTGSLWSAKREVVGDPDQFKYQYVCSSDNKAMIGLWLSYKVVFLIMGAITAFMTRSIDPRFNESQSIALNIYNIIILSSVGMVVSTQLSDLLSAYYLRIIVVFVLVVSSIAFQLGPKFYLLVFPPSDTSTLNTPIRMVRKSAH